MVKPKANIILQKVPDNVETMNELEQKLSEAIVENCEKEVMIEAIYLEEKLKDYGVREKKCIDLLKALESEKKTLQDENEVLKRQIDSSIADKGEIKSLNEKLKIFMERCQYLEDKISRKLSFNGVEEAEPVLADNVSQMVDQITRDSINLSRINFQLSEKLKTTEANNKAMSARIKYLGLNISRLEEENSFAKAREKDLEYQFRMCNDTRMDLIENNSSLQKRILELENLVREQSTESQQIYTNQIQENFKQLKNDYQNSEWFLGEHKKKVEELKNELDSLKESDIVKTYNYDQCQNYIRKLKEELDEVKQFKETTQQTLSDTFLIRKQPEAHRYKWNLMTWNPETSPFDIAEYKRTEFCIESEASEVYLSGTFVNWECNLRCIPNNRNLHSVWVDLPPGRYEFSFITNGKWRASNLHPKCKNSFGTKNNFINIDK